MDEDWPVYPSPPSSPSSSIDTIDIRSNASSAYSSPRRPVIAVARTQTRGRKTLTMHRTRTQFIEILSEVLGMIDFVTEQAWELDNVADDIIAFLIPQVVHRAQCGNL